MSEDKELQEPKEEDSYVWDDDTQLYIHHSSGFYHDPNAGWYYCSKDGQYYKYENGEYVLMEYDESGSNPSRENVTCDPSEHETRVSLSNHGEASIEPTGCSDNQESENPQRPSSWVEDALNELYQADLEHSNYASVVDNQDNQMVSVNGDDESEELEEGEWIPEEDFDPQEHNFDEGVYFAAFSREEALWQAQFGQVIEPPENPLPEIPAIDLWEWKLICESRKEDNEPVARLVGRLVRRSANLHPSVASGGKLFKTAPICEAQLHLVRVKTGQVYKLRNPSAKYLASLSGYDYSNPTKDWGYPEISPTWKTPDRKRKAKKVKRKRDCKLKVKPQDEVNVIEEQGSCSYRDRAAERRNLHGGYGVGPGQKGTMLGLDAEEHDIASEEDAAAEALELSFGSGSYARKIMGNMGWKEGETLGKNTKGLVEPIQAVGNTGNAGLGFPQMRRR